ncbi:histidine kinase [Prauserella coralliicola]|nr:histidine kinase [Prauserella coralliicola]
MTRRSKRPRRDGATEPGLAGGRWRLGNWKLRTRLLAVLLIPVLAVVVLVGLRIASDLDRADEFADGAQRVRVDTTVAVVVHELQRERALTVRYVAEARQGDLAGLRAQRERVDAAIGDFDRTLSAATPDLSQQAVDGFRQLDERLGVLTDLRFDGENSTSPADVVLRSYSELVSGLLDIGDQAAPGLSDQDLARTWLAANALARVKDQLSVRRALVAESLVLEDLPADRMRALLGAEAELGAAYKDFAKFATETQRARYDEIVRGPAVDAGNGMVESVLSSAEANEAFPEIDSDEWDAAATETVDLVKQVQDGLYGQIQQRSDALAADARRSAMTDGAVILGVLLVAAVLTMVIARSLLRPLRVLRSSALEVAQHRLPEAVKGILADPDPRPEDAHRRAVEPVPVFTREELGQVARAFDAVHGEAVRLAGEQAMLRENVNSMFVNLSRRSQDLVERQLSVLDRMEEHEQDPDILGGLFELDHLATRMRRNSENLLVLAGQDAGRPLPGSVSADEIIGAALSEVEHYQRINVAATPRLAVLGEAVSDLVHVISELFENATDYSGDDAPVSVVSSMTEHGEWRIDITDRGAGMPETEIRRANARLAEPPEVDVEVSRRMGLYVVARLARRHQIRVRLSAADIRGLTATVVVPATLIQPGDPIPPPLPVETAAPALPEPSPAPAPAPEPEPEPEPEERRPRVEPRRWPEEEPLPVPAKPADVWREPGQAVSHRAAVQWAPPPEWPVEPDEPSPEEITEPQPALAIDTPTDRLPAYQEVLTQWFETSEDQVAEHVEWPTEDDESPTVSRSPEDVRTRMTSLQNGVRRGRHARAE